MAAIPGAHAGAAPPPRPAAIEHVIDFQDALTGEALPAGDVATLALDARAGGVALSTTAAETSPDGTALRRVWAMPAQGDAYALRVVGDDSRRYFGCEASFPVGGADARRVRVSLVPRARDVSVSVEVRRGDDARGVTADGVRAVDVRASAGSEREVEVHRGRCSGERPAEGSHWCVRSLAAEPGAFGLAARVPGYGVASLTADGRSPERTVALAARYDGHFMPATVLRFGVAAAALHGDGVGAFGSVEVMPGSSLHGQTCPLGATCARPVVHVGAGALPYARDALLLGPGEQSSVEGAVRGTLGLFEVGGGVTVVPGGTGDALRATALASAVLGFRGEELSPAGALPLSAAATRMGLAGELVVAWRLLGPVQLQGSVRAQWFPGFGGVGRRFSFLGDATPANASASLLQIALQVGLGVEL